MPEQPEEETSACENGKEADDADGKCEGIAERGNRSYR